MLTVYQSGVTSFEGIAEVEAHAKAQKDAVAKTSCGNIRLIR
jgi:hypothetical protein